MKIETVSFDCIVKMADDVDSDSDDEIKYSGMIQPPLIKQLQTILSDYPDDGQILKVHLFCVEYIRVCFDNASFELLETPLSSLF